MLIKMTLAAGVAALLMTAGTGLTQTCNNQIPATAPDSRYTNHGNGTVTDIATGLMWKRCAEGLAGPDCASGTVRRLTWRQALQRAQGRTFAGYEDWRLPNVKELSSLVEKKCYAPAINATLFPNTPSSFFWSSSPYAGNSHGAWYVYFYHGYVDDYFKDDGLDVRLVRGGQ